MDLRHYSHQPLGPITDTSQRRPSSHYDKPDGLWVSVAGDDDWLSWCLRENFGAACLIVEHSIELAPAANILVLEGSDALDDFTRQYGVENDYYGYTIDWPRVAADYDGIIIAPYCWQRRLAPHTRWYYGWDCASGCIWSAKAIASVHVVATAEPALPDQTQQVA